MTVAVDRELSSAAMLDMAAAITAAMKIPDNPRGSSLRTNLGMM